MTVTQNDTQNAFDHTEISYCIIFEPVHRCSSCKLLRVRIRGWDKGITILYTDQYINFFPCVFVIL